MTHEQAKELKDAGFPQEPTPDVVAGEEMGGIIMKKGGAVYFVVPEHGGCGGEGFYDDYSYKELLKRNEEYPKYQKLSITKIPSLSELINACGRNAVFLNITMVTPRWWVATAGSGILPSSRMALGETAKIAVAELYIALNKKT